MLHQDTRQGSHLGNKRVQAKFDLGGWEIRQGGQNYFNMVLQRLHARLLISAPRYLLHEGHLQFKAVKAINAAMTTS